MQPKHNIHQQPLYHQLAQVILSQALHHLKVSGKILICLSHIVRRLALKSALFYKRNYKAETA